MRQYATENKLNRLLTHERGNKRNTTKKKCCTRMRNVVYFHFVKMHSHVWNQSKFHLFGLTFFESILAGSACNASKQKHPSLPTITQRTKQTKRIIVFIWGVLNRSAPPHRMRQLFRLTPEGSYGADESSSGKHIAGSNKRIKFVTNRKCAAYALRAPCEPLFQLFICFWLLTNYFHRLHCNNLFITRTHIGFRFHLHCKNDDLQRMHRNRSHIPSSLAD